MQCFERLTFCDTNGAEAKEAKEVDFGSLEAAVRTHISESSRLRGGSLRTIFESVLEDGGEMASHPHRLDDVCSLKVMLTHTNGTM